MTTDDSTADDTLLHFLNFGAGVLSLVCLTCSVVWGLVAQDRMILVTRQRLIAQAVHRVMAVASIAFLLVHIVTKLALDHTIWIAAVIPFGLLVTGGDKVTGNAFLIGLGTLAAMLLIFVGVTGALRNRFASPAPVAARWRAMHMLAYPAWCAALVHGLLAGRAAKPIFVILYCLCLAGVGAALALRAAPRPVKRRVADKIAEIVGSTAERSVGEELDASRARAAESGTGPLPGYEPQRAAQRADPANGFAAAYRAVSPPPHPRQPLTAEQPFAADQTARMDLPMDMPVDMPMGMQPTEALPRVDSDSSTSGSWPIPSPPPVGEAPPSAYDPLNDTGYNIPTYGNPDTGGYGGSDVYDTGESNNLYGTYNPDDTHNRGPANEPPPGESFDAPGSGEPWNTPSGGYR